METIARIPALVAAASGPTTAVGQPITAAGQPTTTADRPAAPRRPGSGFPLRSIAVLALLSVVAWTLATLSEQERLRRQRQPVRVAQEPAATGRGTRTP